MAIFRKFVFLRPEFQGKEKVLFGAHSEKNISQNVYGPEVGAIEQDEPSGCLLGSFLRLPHKSEIDNNVITFELGLNLLFGDCFQ